MMVAVMRLAAVLLSGFFAAGSVLGADAPAPTALAEVRTVYLLPMANALDQYLAHRLTVTGLFQVVTEPKKADAIITDRLGPAFEQRMEEFFPPEKAVEPAKKDDATTTTREAGGFAGQTARPAQSSFSRAKGTLFIVSKAGTVLWSTFERPSNTTSQKLNQAAENITRRLQQDLKRLNQDVKKRTQ